MDKWCGPGLVSYTLEVWRDAELTDRADRDVNSRGSDEETTYIPQIPVG